MTPAPEVAVYSIDPAHSSAQFSVRHLMISNVKGEFSRITGKVSFHPVDLAASTVEADIDVNSISTREAQRDAHLKSADFFDAGKFPVLSFRSRKVQRDGDSYTVLGDLTIRGVTRPVRLEVESFTPEVKDPWGLQRRGATATTKISRKEYGLTWNQVLETGGVAVGDEVKITLDVELVRQ